ncbi:beta-1,6-N-acetylglucosaminyltransferase [Sphingobacterium sp. LRF_L2]|uniref:beta-1,6-N-acetylglucosaminyltransferase n=1 Tax=Sphingobacterium sp. LRF_L2 TaxID=3369421 RepID=UPI003F5E7622
MKHAYLLLAHNDFAVLSCLLEALDDSRNVIYIHFDKKLFELPALELRNAELYVLTERVDVRWGDVSVVEAELNLFAAAYKNGPYGHYHLLSGVDMPLQSQDAIHQFCIENSDKQFVGFSHGDQITHITLKVQRYHIFPKYFRSSGSGFDFLRKALRFLTLRLQFLLGIKRNKSIEFKKGTQWVSLTDDFVNYLLSQRKLILKQYRYTFCADEIFVQTVCWNSRFRSQIFNLENEGLGSQRMIRWRDNRIYDWGIDDLEELKKSDLLFARKFNGREFEVVKCLLRYLKS